MKVRNISNSNRQKNIGKFASDKMQKIIEWESPLERDYIYLLEFDDLTEYYQEQPLRILASINQKSYSYTPDFLVIRSERKYIVEVKPYDFLDEYNTKLKALIGQAYAEKEGLIFKIVTDKDIYEGSFLYNIKLLHRYKRVYTPLPIVHKISRIIDAENSITLEELGEKLGLSSYDYLPIIYNLLYRKILISDLQVPLNKNNMIKLNKK